MESKEKLQDAQVYLDFVKTNLQPLADHLKVSVEWLWAILVQQARVEAIVHLVICLSLAITSGIVIRIFFKSLSKATFGDGLVRTHYKHKETGAIIEFLTEDWEHREDYVGVATRDTTNRHGIIAYISGVASILLLLLSIITSASSLQIIVTGFVNPEFRAIEKIVEFAKPEVEKVQKSVGGKS